MFSRRDTQQDGDDLAMEEDMRMGKVASEYVGEDRGRE